MKTAKWMLAVLVLPATLLVSAQPAPKTLKKILELKIPREGGAHGASVAWNPVLKRYYAAMAGNSSFCLGIFDATGKRLSDSMQKTYFDVRGLWFNPVTKTLQMNGYGTYGWGEYHLNAKGFPDTALVLQKGSHQPEDQSVGVFNPAKKVVCFFNDEGNLDIYDFKSGLYQENFELALGRTAKDDEDSDAGLDGNYDVIDDYNPAIAFTGIAGAEIAILNHTENQIELYNLKDGHMVRYLSLPDDAPVSTFLDFSYANGIYWLFDRDARVWKGYK